MRRGLTLVGLLSAVAVITIGTVAAHTAHYRSRVTILVCCASDGLWDFGGEVTSPHARCEPRRRVKLFRRRGGPDQLMGRDRTDSAGAWAIEPDPSPAGTYYAKVTRKDIGPAGHDHICDPDRSPDLTVPAP
jgi:hypothetical protein